LAAADIGGGAAYNKRNNDAHLSAKSQVETGFGVMK